ncbi:F-box/kelch-repeat protein At3g06240-like [Salvia splendens]|uniref:F-box/kelch-repeat protein At3g06240-like n=1 Tax=Salvia splendens TaxID=180675 RepID=UPI001C25CC9F|nr:F-box/kelch-repeat protein At3g06240-like [Salvia splendens]
METLHLPEEIVTEILSRLPVKSLLRFRCVSKSWRRLIGSKQFIKHHLDISSRHPNFERRQVIFLSLSKSPNFEFKRCSVRSYWDDPSVNPLPICDPINDHLTVSSEIIGHSGGLVCIFNEPMSLILWNPATRISVQLPELDCCDRIIKCGIGWDGESDAYKVFAVLSMKNNESKMMGSIYSSETNSWKAIEEYGSVDLNHWIGEFVCGRMHWIVGSGWIETFDLKSEVFGRIELPEIVDGWFPTVDLDSEIQGRLNLVYCDMNCDYARRRLWEMKEYGVDDSWVSYRLPHVKEPESTYMAWGIEKGEVKLYPRDNIFGCGPECCYVESLVQPVSDNNDA